MRVLITRPEREATALAQALSARGHSPVIAPFFRVQVLHPPADFAASLAHRTPVSASPSASSASRPTGLST